MTQSHPRRTFLVRAVAALGLGAGLLIGTSTPASAAPVTVVPVMKIAASSSGQTGDASYVDYPTSAADRNGNAVLFLGGSAGPASGYQDITSYAAGLGYDTIDLAYTNTQIVGVSCNNNDSCFENFRGETVFGKNVAYGAPVTKSWSSAATTVSGPNSIIGRTVGILDYLESTDSRWSTYLTNDSTSPYTSPHHLGGVRPNWSKIVVAGHSQGGGNAAFLGIQIPVLRVALFSSPNDNIPGPNKTTVPATWITFPSRTPLTSYSGLRNANEGSYGDNTSNNWANLGSSGTAGGVGGTGHGAEAFVGDGSGASGQSQRLVLTSPNTTSLHNHDSTALDAAAGPAVRTAWTTVLTGHAAA